MENDTQSTRPRWQTLIRQNSEKIGAFAENAVLPKNQRSSQNISAPYNLRVTDVEAQNDVYMPTLTARSTPRQQKKYFPFFMISISLIEVLLMYYVDNDLLLIIFGFDPHRRHEIWRYFTIMLVHTGTSHLWSNVIFQLILGVLLEIVHNWKRISIIYLSSILGGSLFITVLSPQTYAVGASAGVYGLLFSHLSTIIINWNEMDRKACRLFWLLAYLTFDIGLSFYSELVIKSDSNTSHVGHFGGAVTGFLVSILVLKNFEKHPWEAKMQKICIAIIITIFTIIFLINVTAWGLYLPTEWNFDYGSTYDNYVLKVIVESAEGSELCKLCKEDSDCNQILEQYKFNGTINST